MNAKQLEGECPSESLSECLKKCSFRQTSKWNLGKSNSPKIATIVFYTFTNTNAKNGHVTIKVPRWSEYRRLLQRGTQFAIKLGPGSQPRWMVHGDPWSCVADAVWRHWLTHEAHRRPSHLHLSSCSTPHTVHFSQTRGSFRMMGNEKSEEGIFSRFCIFMHQKVKQSALIMRSFRGLWLYRLIMYIHDNQRPPMRTWFEKVKLNQSIDRCLR